MAQTLQNKIETALSEHSLPPEFMGTIEQWYKPIAQELAHKANAQSRCMLVGIQGCQGSGKSTLAAFLKIILETNHKLTTAVLSIDDFYLTKSERASLAEKIHPMLATRGVPGTHDIRLAQQTIDELRSLSHERSTRLPRFNKAIDDRAPVDAWPNIHGPVDIIILEGWCVGLRPQDDASLHEPVNTLEREQDEDRQWRTYVNKQLDGPYQDLFQQFDELIVLLAPSFDCVYEWRLLQEQKLVEHTLLKNPKASLAETLSPDQVRQFIAHYQRLTEHGMTTLPRYANYVLTLSDDHQISNMQRQNRAL